MSAPAKLLEVRNLRVEFNTRRGTLVAIDDVSFDIAPGEVLGVVGESGAGKVHHRHLDHRAPRSSGRIAGGEILLEGRRIDNLPGEEMRKIRGRRIGAIFQDPLTSLNPLYTIGRQIIETIQTHLPLSAAAARNARSSCSAKSESPRRSGASTISRTSFPAGCASASSSRSRSAPTRAHHRRRADHRARRLDPGADHHAA
jgi:ABC-type glutathione transport system ATPase component